jgi:uncharacterized membrane protein YedE/YeeE
MTLVYALIVGAAFGAILDRIGATSPSCIVGMAKLTNLRIIKTILLAIGVSSMLMFGGQMIGLVDIGHMSVKTAYAGVFIGGLLLGVGWALSGFCPGTGVAAAGAGRKDALFFIAGGLLGAAAYMVTYPAWKASGLLDGFAGGKVTMGTIEGSKYDGLTALPGDVLGIVLGLVLIAVAFALPDRLLDKPAGLQPAE